MKANNNKLNARIGKIWPKSIFLKANTNTIQKVVLGQSKK